MAAGETPSTSSGEALDYIPRRNLGSGALVGFFFGFLAKTSMLLILFAIGIALMPKVFIAVMIGYIALTFLIAMLLYNNFFFLIDEDGLTIESGIIHKQQVTVPYDQIQNVNIERTLMDRILGVSKVSIETAGSSADTKPGLGAEAFLPGVDFEFAKKIHDLLIDLSEKANQ